MARRLHQSLADYVVIAISPALIMTLVGSLVFFLLAVFYQGDFSARLHWVMACFVFAAVLIGRISIVEGFERAAPFGAALALVVGIAANQFIFLEFKGGWISSFGWIINWCLIAITWWCAHRLTWDCTLIDDEQDSSGEGLMQIAGLERPADFTDSQKQSLAQRIEGTTSRQEPAGIWQRYVEHQRRPHAPGVWVVYFSLAALPLFGIGQWFIPEANAAGRRYIFWLLILYVGSGLSLLLTTSFLGLRRYLRQRRIEMPTLMANLWLGTGAVIVILLLLLAALLPRPSAEYAISRLPFAVGSPPQNASRMAPINRKGTDDKTAEQQTAPAREPHDDSQATDPSGQNQPGSPTGSQTDSNSQQSDESQKSSESSSQNNSSPKNSQPSKSSQSQERWQKPDRKSDLAKAIQRHQKEQAKQSPQTTPPDDSRPPPKDDNSSPQNNHAPPPQSENTMSQSVEALKSLEMVEGGIESAADILAELLKWAFYAAFILAVLYFLWWFWPDVLAALRGFLAALRDLWNNLLGRKRRSVAASESGLIPEFPPIPFSNYADPFATGIASRYSTEELIRYTFEAFEAWAREHGCPRLPDQTPHEWTRNVGKLNTFIAADARNLAELYARAAYAEGKLPPTSLDHLQKLWQSMGQSVATSFP